MHWSSEHLSAFFGSSVLSPTAPEHPYTIGFEDDLISGELFVQPAGGYALVRVRRGRSRQDLFEFSVPCQMIKPDVLTGGIPGIFFFTGEAARMEDCSLCITKDSEGRFAFYPALRPAQKYAQS